MYVQNKPFVYLFIYLGKDAVELEVTLDGEGKDRVFRVSIKWHAQVNNSSFKHFVYSFLICSSLLTFSFIHLLII